MDREHSSARTQASHAIASDPQLIRAQSQFLLSNVTSSTLAAAHWGNNVRFFRSIVVLISCFGMLFSSQRRIFDCVTAYICYEEDEHGAMIHFDNENSCTDAAHTVSIRGSETGKEFQACPLSPSTYRCRKENVQKVMTALGGEANKR